MLFKDPGIQKRVERLGRYLAIHKPQKDKTLLLMMSIKEMITAMIEKGKDQLSDAEFAHLVEQETNAEMHIVKYLNLNYRRNKAGLLERSTKSILA